jgi:hypothetical protein
MTTPFNQTPHLPDFDDMDPDGCIEILLGEDDDGYQHLEYQHVCHYRDDCTKLGRTRPWRRTKEWIPRIQDYSEADFAWALSRILKNIQSTYDLKSLKIGLTDGECGRILTMRDQANKKASTPPPSHISSGG